MQNEFWGTLSIYDHRDPIFIKSLILFDRIVIPIPDSPFGTLNKEELMELNKKAEKLAENNAAVIYNWNPVEFQDWQTETFREALTIQKTDKLFHTRLQLLKKIDDLKPEGVKYINAVPVYGARKEFSDTYAKVALGSADNLMIEISQLISTPDDETPIEKVIELRNEESFQSARRALRDWQIQKMPDALCEQSEKKISLAMDEFEQMLKRYEEEIKKGKFGKKKVVVTSLLALGALVSAAFGQIPTAIAIMSGAAPHLFSLRESLTPAWKDIRDKKFEAAGVIYEANKILELKKNGI